MSNPMRTLETTPEGTKLAHRTGPIRLHRPGGLPALARSRDIWKKAANASVGTTEPLSTARDASDAELVCIAGGDGTVRMVVEAHGKRAELPPLAIFPCGTINLLARELGYPADHEAFARRIGGKRQARSSALAFAGKHPFLACASIGADLRQECGGKGLLRCCPAGDIA